MYELFLHAQGFLCNIYQNYGIISKVMIAIIDYKAGNLFSVKNAFDKLGVDTVITSDVDVIKNADKLLLPGVGAFENAMNHMRELKLDNVIVDEVKSGKPFLGICLGMQLLFNSSEEYGHHEGLNILEGKIIHFNFSTVGAKHSEPALVGANLCEPALKIPHMGWNSITNCKDTKLFSDLENQFVYFVHSYHLVTDNKDYKQIITNYGYDFCSAIEYKNIFATQFHPEKSGDAGLSILKKFAIL